MRILPVILLAAAFVLLYGCIQVSVPQECASVSSADQPGCIYYTAVMAQDPYPCYAIPDKTQRETCLRDAIDPSAKKNLQRSSAAASRTVPVAANSSGFQVPAAVPSNSAPNSSEPTGNSSSGGLVHNTPPAEQNDTEVPASGNSPPLSPSA